MKTTIRFSPVVFIFAPAFFLPVCGSDQLPRSAPQRLIEAGEDYKQPFALELMQGATLLPSGKALYVLDSGAPETPEQAAAGKIKEHYEKHPPVAGKEIVALTGITKPDENRAAAQFTRKFAPNEAGSVFGAATAEFKDSPARVAAASRRHAPADRRSFKAGQQNDVVRRRAATGRGVVSPLRRRLAARSRLVSITEI